MHQEILVNISIYINETSLIKYIYNNRYICPDEDETNRESKNLYKSIKNASKLTIYKISGSEAHL